jgi:hypothetical protein
MTVILDTADLADNFLVTVERFEQKRFKQIVSKLTKEQAFTIIQAFVDDALNQRMRWAKNSTHAENAIEAAIAWTDNRQARKQRNEFYIDIVDAYELTIHSRLDPFMPKHTWDIWSTRLIGNDIVLMKGVDYRIYDWERRIASGEWQDENIHP